MRISDWSSDVCSSDLPPSALVLEAPPSSIADVAQAHYWYLPVRLLIRDPWDSLARIAEVGAPVLILHGERDPVVPIRFGRKLFEAAAEPKRALWQEEALHTAILSYPDVMREVLDFIRARSRCRILRACEKDRWRGGFTAEERRGRK